MTEPSLASSTVAGHAVSDPRLRAGILKGLNGPHVSLVLQVLAPGIASWADREKATKTLDFQVHKAPLSVKRKRVRGADYSVKQCLELHHDDSRDVP